MKKITVSVDEKVLAAVRRLAAERKSSVNVLARDYLTNLAAQEERIVGICGGHRLEISPGPSREEPLKAIRRLARPLPPGFKFDREEANRR
jgi:hypothetical protein